MSAECNLKSTSENIESVGMSEINGALLMELLDDSSYIEPEVDEDDRLGRVIQSLQAEISNVDMVISVDSPFDDCGLIGEMVMSDIDGVDEYRSDWVEMDHVAAEFMEECSSLCFYCGGEPPMEQEYSPLWD